MCASSLGPFGTHTEILRVSGIPVITTPLESGVPANVGLIVSRVSAQSFLECLAFNVPFLLLMPLNVLDSKLVLSMCRHRKIQVHILPPAQQVSEHTMAWFQFKQDAERFQVTFME